MMEKDELLVGRVAHFTFLDHQQDVKKVTPVECWGLITESHDSHFIVHCWSNTFDTDDIRAQHDTFFVIIKAAILELRVFTKFQKIKEYDTKQIH